MPSGVPDSLVIRNAASKETKLWPLGTSETGYQGALWTTTAPHLQWLVPLMHGDVCRSPVHGGSELFLRVLCDC